MVSFAFRLGLALTLVASTGWARTPAMAADPAGGAATVAVFELHDASQPHVEALAALAKLVEARLGGSPGVTLVARADIEARLRAAFPPTAVTPVPQAEEIRKAVKDAEDAFFAGDTKGALERLKGANEKLRKALDGPSHGEAVRKEYIASQMLLVLIHHRSRQDKDAREVATELMKRVGDDASINEDNFHPEAVAIFRDTWKALAPKRVGKLAITSDPAGAEIDVNGTRLTQKTPATVEGLFPGRAFVQVRLGERASLVKDVVIDEAKPASLAVDLAFESAAVFDGARFGLAFRDAEEAKRVLPVFAAKLGRIADVDQVVLVGLGAHGGKTRAEAFLASGRAAELVRGAELPLHGESATAAEAERLVASLMTGASAEGDARPWYTNTVGWILTGVGVVGISVGAAMYVAYRDDRAIAECNPSVATCKLESARRAAKRSAETERGVAYAGFGVGAASLIGGVLAFVLMDGQADEDAVTKVVPFVVPGGGGVGATLRF